MKLFLTTLLLFSNIFVFASEPQDRFGMTPLANALMLHQINESIASFNRSPESLLVQDKKDGYCALHYIAILDQNKADSLLKIIPDSLLEKAITLEDRYGRTALDIATKFNRLSFVKHVYERSCAKIIPQIKKDNQLLDAADQGNVEIVVILLKHQANVNIKNMKGQTPLILSAPFKKGGAFKEIIQANPNLNIADSEQRTALHYACDIGSVPHVTALLQKGAKIDPVDIKGETPLFYATEGAHEKILPFLVQYKTNIHHKNKKGMTPLMVAAKKRFIDGVVFLTEQGAKIDDQDLLGFTAAMWGTEQMDYTVVEYLLDAGSDSMLKNKAGETLLDVAKKEKNEDVILLLEKNRRLSF